MPENMPQVLRWLNEWEPTGELVGDLTEWAVIQQLAEAVARVRDGWEHTIGEMIEVDVLENPGAGIVAKRQWRSGTVTWDETGDVIAAIADHIDGDDAQLLAVIERCAPKRVAWRSTALAQLGIDPDDLRRKKQGRWTVDVTVEPF